MNSTVHVRDVYKSYCAAVLNFGGFQSFYGLPAVYLMLNISEVDESTFTDILNEAV